MSNFNQNPYNNGYNVNNNFAGSNEFAQPQFGAFPDPRTGFMPSNSWSRGWLNYREPSYIKGLLLGAGAAVILTNPKVQKCLMKGAVNLWAAVQGGVEEIKEQIQDIKSEMSINDESK